MTEMIGTAGEEMLLALEELFSALASSALSSTYGIAAYVLTSLSLYSIAQRRGIKNPWLAWLPVVNLWILGSIADQYRYVVKGEVRSRRKTLLTLSIAQTVLTLVLIVVAVVLVVRLVMELPGLEYMTEMQLGAEFAGIVLAVVVVAVLMMVVAIASTVIQYIALHDIYASCEPGNKTLYLVLSILISITMPVFLFVCRNKDDGMPPRKAQQTAPVQPAVEEIPAMEAPEEPWVNTEE